MQILKIKTKTIVLLAVLIALSTVNTFAQRNIKARERIDQVKKVKLLEILELDEKSADKFLAKYTAWENKIKEKKEATDLISDEIEVAIKKKVDKSEISKLTNKYMDSMNEFHKMMLDRNNDIKSILDEIQFAKYLIFEENFFKDIQKVMFRMMKQRGGDMHEPPDRPRKRK